LILKKEFPQVASAVWYVQPIPICNLISRQ
jgi:hypothetical protein